MNRDVPRVARERKTLRFMIEIYCKGIHHQGVPLCRDCEELHDYAMARLDECPFQEEKPTCKDCAVHCYQEDYSDRIKSVMRFSGPRMIYRHPVLAVRHLIDGGIAGAN